MGIHCLGLTCVHGPLGLPWGTYLFCKLKNSSPQWHLTSHRLAQRVLPSSLLLKLCHINVWLQLQGKQIFTNAPNTAFWADKKVQTASLTTRMRSSRRRPLQVDSTNQWNNKTCRYWPTDVGSSPHCNTTFFVIFPFESTYTPSSEKEIKNILPI